MGWDVVQIGLRHNLPVESPRETAKAIAERMKRNVCIGYRKEYDFNSETEELDWADHYDLVEIEKIIVNDTDDFIFLTITNYQVLQIQDSLGIEKIRELSKSNEVAEFILYDLEEPAPIYELEIEEDDEKKMIDIFKENVTLDIYVIERWFNWAREFEEPDDCGEYLRNYRMQVFNQAKIFGCEEVINCADQGPTMAIYDNADYSADELKEYVRSRKYVEDSNWLEPKKIEHWKKYGRHVKFSDFFENKLSFEDDDFVELVYDDFSDMIMEDQTKGTEQQKKIKADTEQYELYSALNIGNNSMKETVVAILTGDVTKVEKLLDNNKGKPLPICMWNGQRRGTLSNGWLDSFDLAQALYDTLRHDKYYKELKEKAEEIWNLHKKRFPERKRVQYDKYNFISWNWENSPGDNPYFLDDEEEELVASGVIQGNICMTNFGIQHMEDFVVAMLKAGGNPYFLLTGSCCETYQNEDGEILYSYHDVAPMLDICATHSSDYWNDLIRLGFGKDIFNQSKGNLEYAVNCIFEIAANERILHLTDKYITDKARKAGEELMMKYLGKIYPILC